MDVGHFGLAGVVEHVRLGADGVQFQQGAFGEAGEGVLPEVEFQHAGEVLPGGQVRGDVGFGPVEWGRKGLGDGGAEFWADNGVGAAVCRVFHYGQADVVVANGGIADDGAGGFDGAELGVVFFCGSTGSTTPAGQRRRKPACRVPRKCSNSFQSRSFFH